MQISYNIKNINFAINYLERLCFIDDTFIIKKQSPPGGGFCVFLGDIKLNACHEKIKCRKATM